MTKESIVDRKKLKAAFERLKVNASQVMRRGTKVSVSSVQKEAELPLGTMSKDNHAELFHEVNGYKVTTIDRLTAAFERLKIDEPIIKKKGTKVSVSTVQQEAGFSLGTMSIDKHSELFEEVNEYKENLKKLKAQKDGLEALSQEESMQSKLKTAERRRKKYYDLMKQAKDELARHQEKEVMVLQAMFELLDVHSKDKLINAGNEGITGIQAVTYESIKKATHIKQVK